MLCKLLSDGDAIRKGKVMPYQIDMANEVLNAEFSDANSRKISKALLVGYELALPNLAELLTGDTLVIVDFSGSMTSRVVDPKRKTSYSSTCMDKAALKAATIAKATNGDIIRFGQIECHFVLPKTESTDFGNATTTVAPTSSESTAPKMKIVIGVAVAAILAVVIASFLF